MAQYFYLHDPVVFREEIVPALGQAWRLRQFSRCRVLAERLASQAQAYAARFHTGAETTLLEQLAREDLPFDRGLWRLLAGEVLLFGAVEVPYHLTASDTLATWLNGPPPEFRVGARSGLTLSAAIHDGVRDLQLGAVPYRPLAAGLNDVDDVPPLALALENLDVRTWTPHQLPTEQGDLEERTEALEYAIGVFESLRSLYRRVASSGLMVICECH